MVAGGVEVDPGVTVLGALERQHGAAVGVGGARAAAGGTRRSTATRCCDVYCGILSASRSIFSTCGSENSTPVFGPSA